MIPIETQIFRLIFPPAGAIPLEKIEAVPHIRQHINSIIDLASTEHGISPPDESAALTARVIELRDTPGPDGKVRTWRTIAEICGTTLDAVRHRYVKGKATIRKSRTVEDAALSGYDIKDKLAEFIEGPTAEVDRLRGLLTEPDGPIQTINEAFATVKELGGDEAEITASSSETPTKPSKAGLTPCQRGHLIGPKIPHELDDELIVLREAGSSLKEIVNHLDCLGIKCTEADVSARVLSEQRKRAAAKKAEEATVQAEAPPTPQDDEAPTEDVPHEAEATDDRLKPVSISRKELDLLMWDLHKAGKTLDEISDILYSKGLYYSPKSVRVRLLSQGAKL